jgi:hypothetical protein
MRFPLALQYNPMEPKKPESDLIDPYKTRRKVSRERRKYVREHALSGDERNKK